MNWDREEIENQLREREYGGGQTLFQMIPPPYRHAMPIHEGYDFIRAYDAASPEIRQIALELTEKRAMNPIDFVSLYVGILRYHQLESVGLNLPTIVG